MPDIRKGVDVTDTPRDIKAYFPLTVGSRYVLQNKQFSPVNILQVTDDRASDDEPITLFEKEKIGVRVDANKIWVWTEAGHASRLAVGDAA